LKSAEPDLGQTHPFKQDADAAPDLGNGPGGIAGGVGEETGEGDCEADEVVLVEGDAPDDDPAGAPLGGPQALSASAQITA